MSVVLSLEALKAAVARERSAGASIALANGCFDLLHVGHVRYLQGAAAEGDVLVVAVNDDDSVCRLKGPGRPVFPAADRAELVAGIRGVSYVVIFSGPTVAPVIAAIRPDVHCKGTDYTAENVPEREHVLAYGGRVAIVGDPKEHSTRDLVRKLGAPQARPAGQPPPALRRPAEASAKAGAERGTGAPASDGDGGSGGAKPPGL